MLGKCKQDISRPAHINTELRPQDVYSYNMEQARGIAGNNIVTVLMQEKGVDLQTAANLVGEHTYQLMTRFTEGKKRLPSWGIEVDAAVAAYVRAIECWIKGNLDWSFETQRYFGPRHTEVKQTLVVELQRPELRDP